MPGDPFGTAALRSRVLAAWTASPARFREDANAEEDFALGAYRDRLVVELAQNAADAAARAGVPGRLSLALRDRELVAANTGAPLDAAGVEAAATLRASAKRGEPTVGRFGVGFAAVLAVTDEPSIHCATGGVRWSRVLAAELVAARHELAAELAERGGHVPVLRLPLAADAGDVPAGFDTTVRLPLRDAAAEDLTRQLLAQVDAALLLSLPALVEVLVEVDGRVRRLASRRCGGDLEVDDDGASTRWRVATADGRLPEQVLADRPTEERRRPFWSLLWAVPVDAGDRPCPPEGLPMVVRSPTPTDDALSLPAVLIGSFPLDSTRRRLAPGPLRDLLVDRAGALYADLVRDLAPDPAVLTLVPTGLAAGEVDARLHRAVLDALGETAWLPSAADAGLRLRPRETVALDDPLVEVLTPAVPTLLAAGFTGGRREAALAVLGVRRPPLAEVVEALAAVDREPAWWRDLYAGLAATVPGGPEHDALGALPVPLADGRLVTGPRGLFLLDGGTAVPAEAFAALGLRVVHPEAAHPLLGRLGAVEASPRSVLDDGRVRAAVAASYDEDEPTSVAEAVLSLVAAAGLGPGEEPWLAELALPGADGEVYPAGELLLPGGRLATLVSADAPFGVAAPQLLERWGPDTLLAVGVLDTFAVLREPDVVLDGDADGFDLDREDEWVEAVRAGLLDADVPAVLAELVAVRDLELVRADAWPVALSLLAAPPLRDAVVLPAVVSLRTSAVVEVPAYTAWWLSEAPVLAGRRPVDLRGADADPLLDGLCDPVPEEVTLDEVFLRAVGVRTSPTDLDADELLTRMADPARVVTREQARRLYAGLAGRVAEPPSRLRAVRHGALVVVDAADAVVVDAPDLLALLGDRAVLPCPLSLATDLADLLDLPLASELAPFAVRSAGQPMTEAGEPYVGHRELLVADVDGRPTRVPWRLLDEVLHVDLGSRETGLGRGLAWARGRWGQRSLLTEELRDPGSLPVLQAEADLDD